MAIRNIVTFDETFLRKKSREVTQFDQRLFTLLDDLKETLTYADGAGLAAVQVGVLRRVAVVDAGSGLIELINPQIIKRMGKQKGTEGCLSFPKKYGVVERPNYVKVKTYDRKGKPVFVEGEQIVARALCHEIDHMDGKLFQDLASQLLEEQNQ